MSRMHPLLLACLIPALTLAAEAPPADTKDSEKIDSILVISKKLERTLKNDPLAGKRFGVEVNPFRLLLWGEGASFSGGVSLFNVSRSAELAFPFLYARSETEDFAGGGYSNIDFTEITQDVHYRYFLGNTQNGFYLSSFARFAFLTGIEGPTMSDYVYSATPEPMKRSSEGKLGIGFGLGYRIFSYRGLYWGCSASFGRYLIGDNDRFRPGAFGLDDDEKFIFDLEFLKVGWAF
jgi:hypothetical protein